MAVSYRHGADGPRRELQRRERPAGGIVAVERDDRGSLVVDGHDDAVERSDEPGAGGLQVGLLPGPAVVERVKARLAAQPLDRLGLDRGKPRRHDPVEPAALRDLLHVDAKRPLARERHDAEVAARGDAEGDLLAGQLGLAARR